MGSVPTNVSHVIAMFGLILGYAKNDQAKKAVSLLDEIRCPNGIIMTILCNACAYSGSNEALHLVKKVSSTMQQSCLSDGIFMPCLIDALLVCGDTPSAEVCFTRSESKRLKMCGEMMKVRKTSHELKCSSNFSVGYITNDVPKKGSDVFHQVQRFDDVLSILLFDTCAKLADDEALKSLRAYSSSYDHLKCPMFA